MEWKNEYIDEDGLKRYIRKDECDKTGEEEEFEIVFDIDNERYYCYVEALNINEALGIFFRTHETIAYKDIFDHFDI